jgi:hypothetical protein
MSEATIWEIASQSANILGTDFDTKTDGTTVTVTTVIDNSAGSYMYIDLELVLGSLTPGTNGYVLVELFPSLDGTNYGDIVAEQGTGTVSRVATSGASVKRLPIYSFIIKPLKYKVVLTNKLGATTAGSGNSLTYRLSREKGTTV